MTSVPAHRRSPTSAVTLSIAIALAWALGIELLAPGWERANDLAGYSAWWLLVDYGVAAPFFGVVAGYLIEWDTMVARHPTPRDRMLVLCRDAGISVAGSVVLTLGICTHIAGSAIVPMALIYAATTSLVLGLMEHAD